jgi:adenine phosphoribosyltransferase
MFPREFKKDTHNSSDAVKKVPLSLFAASSPALYSEPNPYSALSERIEQSLIPYENFPYSDIVYRDISPILENPKLFSEIIDHLSSRYNRNQESKVDAVVALEARGFIFGAALAYQLKLPLVMIRKAGKLPGDVYQTSYEKLYQVSYKKLYGSDSIVMRKDALKGGERVIIIDDFYSTGGSLQAATKLVQAAGATVYEGAFIINNMLVPTKLSFPFPIYSLSTLKPKGAILSSANSSISKPLISEMPTATTLNKL